MRPAVYLAGPISGAVENDAVAWRNVVRETLSSEIDTIDPLRMTTDFSRSYGTSDLVKAMDRMQHGRSAVSKMLFDLKRSDVVLANLTGASDISIGTVAELFLANNANIPTVVVKEQSGNVHDHAMLNAIISFSFVDLTDAIKCVRGLVMKSYWDGSSHVL